MSASPQSSAGTSFIISFDGDEPEKRKPNSRVPKRLLKNETKPEVTSEMLEEKQQKAEERRKAIGDEKQARIKLVHEQCMQVNSAAERLLAQEALRKSQHDLTNVKPMSRSQIKQEINNLQKGLKKLEDISNTKLSYDYQPD